jgi:hypothetical protein
VGRDVRAGRPAPLFSVAVRNFDKVKVFPLAHQDEGSDASPKTAVIDF